MPSIIIDMYAAPKVSEDYTADFMSSRPVDYEYRDKPELELNLKSSSFPDDREIPDVVELPSLWQYERLQTPSSDQAQNLANDVRRILRSVSTISGAELDDISPVSVNTTLPYGTPSAGILYTGRQICRLCVLRWIITATV